MTIVCSLVGHKMPKDGYACVRCWPGGVPKDLEESLLRLVEAIKEVKAAAQGKAAHAHCAVCVASRPFCCDCEAPLSRIEGGGKA